MRLKSKPIGYSYRCDIVGKPVRGTVEGDTKLRSMGGGWTPAKEATPQQLQDMLKRGWAVAPGIHEGGLKKKETFVGGQYVFLDFDGTMRWEDAKNHEWFKQHALFGFTSASHGNGKGDRFRVVGVLEKPLRTAEEYDSAVAALREYIPGQDTAMVSSQASFGNPNAEWHTYDLNNVMPVLEKQKVERTSRPNQVVEDLSIRLEKAKLCLAVVPPRGPAGSGTYPDAIAALASIVNEFGADQAIDLVNDCNWYDAGCDPGEWNLERKAYSLEADNKPEDQQRRLGSLIEQARELLADDPEQLEAFNLGLDGINAKAREAEVDVANLFTSIEGYKVGDALPKPVASIKTSKVQMNGEWVEVCWMTDLNGNRHDITYAHNKNLMNKHLIKAVDVVAQDSHFRFDVANQLVIRDGERVPEKQLKTLHLVLSNEYGINFPEATKGAIEAIAMRDCFDPYVDELLEIEQRVTPIDISNLATRYFKATSPLADVMMEKWLVGLVGRLLNPGLPLRGVLVLVGAQHIGKDGFLNVLTQQRVKSVGRDSKLKDRDFLLAANSCWVVNLAEIENITRSQATGELKSWITEARDIVTLKWENQATNFPRRFSLYGSCNHAKFLQDPSGNTRYWVIESPLTRENRVDLDLLEQERESILAGAIQLYRKFQRKEYQIELDDHQSRVSEAHNAAYVEDAAFVHDLQLKLEGRTCTTKAEVLEMLEIDQAGQKANKTITNQVDLSLEQLGFKCVGSRKLRENGKPDVSVKVLARCQEFDLNELRVYLNKPGQKWARCDF